MMSKVDLIARRRTAIQHYTWLKCPLLSITKQPRVTFPNPKLMAEHARVFFHLGVRAHWNDRKVMEEDDHAEI